MIVVRFFIYFRLEQIEFKNFYKAHQKIPKTYFKSRTFVLMHLNIDTFFHSLAFADLKKTSLKCQ